MENNDSTVEVATEPQIQSRFGCGKGDQILSSKTVKVCAVVTVVAIFTVFLMRSPDPTPQENPGIKTPEPSEVMTSSENFSIETYSASEDRERLKEKTKRNNSKVIVRFTGLEKIDRRKSGQIPPGSLLKAILTTGASNGPVKVELTEALRIQGETLLPVGAILLGSGQSTEERLMIRFSQVVFKDGTFETIQAEAADIEDKTVGLRGSRVGKYAVKYAAAIGLNFVGGMAEGLQDREVVGQQVVTQPTARNALLNGASKATLEMANETMTDIRNKAPIIQIEAGKEIYVIFDGGK